jgi:hypothetical protein
LGAVETEHSELTLWETVKSDFAQSTGLRLLGVAAMFLWMAFQWGWGNDILLPPIVATAFEAVDDGETWSTAIGASAAGTAAGSLFWGVTQAIDGIIMMLGLRLVPGVTARIGSFLQRKGWVKPVAELSLGTKFLIAYATGASVLCLIDVFATGEPGLRSRRGLLAQAVGLAVAGVAAAIAVVTIVTAIGTRIEATEDAAEVIVRYAKNPLTWLVLYAAVVGLSSLRSRLGGSRPVPELA